MITHIRYPRPYFIFFLPRARPAVWMTRALLIFFAVMMAVYGYSLIASVGLTYHVERELDRRAEIVESHRALEDAYVAKLEDVRAAGNVLGLRMPERTRFIESFSSVAKADL